jgi:hypothetical protein
LFGRYDFPSGIRRFTSMRQRQARRSYSTSCVVAHNRDGAMIRRSV